MKFAKLTSFVQFVKQRPLYSSIGTPLIIILFCLSFVLLGSYFTRLVHASFGTWGDSSLINACVDSRGRPIVVSPGTSCNSGETQITWLKDIDAGTGLSISRSSSGVTISATNNATDGWTTSSSTWTYASSNSITISGDQTATYTPGTRVKATNNGTTYYGTVASSSYSSPNTTVSFVANNDYSLANSAITSTFYSYQSNPQGYPGWFNYTPTWGGFSVNPSGGFSKFEINGRVCIVEILTTSDGTSNATTLTVTGPVNAATSMINIGLAIAADNGVSLTNPALVSATSGSNVFTVYKDLTGAGWTSSGAKAVNFTATYAF